MHTLISIALCTYNGSKYLKEQVLSIINQTYKNIELVIVDDCSTDDTIIILNELANTFTKIRVHQNEKNLGFNSNFQKAISLCTGDFIAVADQDDIWLPNKLEVLLANIKDNWLVFSNSELIDDEGKKLAQQILKPEFSLKGKSYKSFLFYNSVTGHTLMINREFQQYFMPIPKSGYYDWWMGFIAMYHRKAVYVNQCLTLHRLHHTSTTFTTYNKQTKEKRQVLRNEILTNLQLLQDYKGLSNNDRLLIKKISSSYKKRISLFLIELIVKYYNIYFPDYKPRSWKSRLNFAIQFSKGKY